MTISNHHLIAREMLEQWQRLQRQNPYEADRHFQRILSVYIEPSQRQALQSTLASFGQQICDVVDALVIENNLSTNLPELKRWSALGTRLEQIAHHPTYHAIGRYIYGSGIMAAYAQHPNTRGALSRFYISSFLGEAGHNCPLACTAGVIRVLQELGDPALKERYLPGLLNPDYDDHLEGAQFLTEIQGGSDVGANTTYATQNPDKTWSIFGEKWFCSNIDADLFLMTARIAGAPKGTAGLGLFLVPRQLDDETVNDFYIRRLKDKLGTRSMASGECDFRGAKAYHLGELTDGFKNMMKLVINTSRLYNAVGASGTARRAQMIAQTYAQHRLAFGHPINHYPLVQETLANIKSETDAMLSGTFYLANIQDKIDSDQATPNEHQFFRLAVNINKSLTAKASRSVVVQAIEVLGGNGAIESFSILPRLLRDAIVYENWEGTHNTLYMQVLRDMHKYKVHEGFLSHLLELLHQCTNPANEPLITELTNALNQLKQVIDALLKTDTATASLKMRPLCDELTYLMQACIRLYERSIHKVEDPVDELSLYHFLDLRLRPMRQTPEQVYLQRIKQLAVTI